MATYSNVLAWENPTNREPWWATGCRVAELDKTEATERAQIHLAK